MARANAWIRSLLVSPAADERDGRSGRFWAAWNNKAACTVKQKSLFCICMKSVSGDIAQFRGPTACDLVIFNVLSDLGI